MIMLHLYKLYQVQEFAETVSSVVPGAVTGLHEIIVRNYVVPLNPDPNFF